MRIKVSSSHLTYLRETGQSHTRIYAMSRHSLPHQSPTSYLYQIYRSTGQSQIMDSPGTVSHIILIPYIQINRSVALCTVQAQSPTSYLYQIFRSAGQIHTMHSPGTVSHIILIPYIQIKAIVNLCVVLSYVSVTLFFTCVYIYKYNLFLTSVYIHVTSLLNYICMSPHS